MDRRTILQGLGGGLAGTVLAGCLGAPVNGQSPTASTTTETESNDDFAWDPATAVPVTDVRIGTPRTDDEVRPRDVRMWNDTDAAIEVALLVSEGDRVRYDDQQSLPADGFLIVSFVESGRYTLRVQAGDRATTITIPRESFDCNQTWTDLQVPADGPIRQRTTSTEIACPPRIRQTRMELTAMDGVQPGRCGTENEASVAWDGETITITGSIEVPTPCHGGKLASASIDQPDTLTVTIETVDPPEGTVCIECVGTVAYRAIVSVTPRLPGTVVVSHDGTDVERAPR